MDVPFLNPGAQYAALKDELLCAVEKVLADGRFILGPNVAALEQEIAALTGTRFGVGVNSGGGTPIASAERRIYRSGEGCDGVLATA